MTSSFFLQKISPSPAESGINEAETLKNKSRHVLKDKTQTILCGGGLSAE